MTNAELFKKTFGGLWATEMWAKPEQEFLEWLNSEAKTEQPRVLALCEVLTASGAGWLEEWYEADEETPESHELSECAWCGGNILSVDELGVANHSVEDQVRSHYGQKYGFRIWTAKPTPEQQEATTWQSE